MSTADAATTDRLEPSFFSISWQKTMMWMFIVTDGLLFGSFLAVYGYKRLAAGHWPDRTEVFHLAGFGLRTRDGHPESGSVGVLEWSDGDGSFAFIEDEDLAPFTRHNWKWV